MSADFEIPTAVIKVGKGSFTVRGMNSEDVVMLTSVYFEDLKRLVADFGVKDGVVPANKVQELVLSVVKTFPMMTAEMISRCADAPEQLEKFRNLSFVKNIEAIKAIMDLSVEDGHDLKKLGEGLISLLEANGQKLGPLRTLLQNIIKTSANQSPI